jgi:hypothetical protein
LAALTFVLFIGILYILPRVEFTAIQSKNYEGVVAPLPRVELSGNLIPVRPKFDVLDLAFALVYWENLFAVRKTNIRPRISSMRPFYPLQFVVPNLAFALVYWENLLVVRKTNIRLGRHFMRPFHRPPPGVGRMLSRPAATLA